MVSLRPSEACLAVFALVATGVVAACITVALLILVMQFHAWLCMPRRERIEPILVEESPRPTMSKFEPTTSPVVLRTKAKRAGRMRVCFHRSRVTRRYSPSLPGECGFQVVLRAACRSTSKANVKKLRSAVAEEFVKARLEGLEIAGIDPHELLRSEGMTLKAYAQAVRADLWASKVEIHLAAKISGVSLLYQDSDTFQVLGEGPLEHVVKLEARHFTLHRIHRKKTQYVSRTSPTSQRGGMRNTVDWLTPAPRVSSDDTRQSFANLLHLDDALPPPASEVDTPRDQRIEEVEEPYHPANTYVAQVEDDMTMSGEHLDQASQFVDIVVDVGRLGMELQQAVVRLPNQATVDELKRVVSAMVGAHDHNLDILFGEEEDSLPDWVQPPRQVVVDYKQGAIPSLQVKVNVPWRGYTICLMVPQVDPVRYIKEQMCVIMQVPPGEIAVYGKDGNPLQGMPIHGQMLLVERILQRAGMRRSLSPTQPMSSYPSTSRNTEQSDEESSEVQEATWRDQVEAAGGEYLPPEQRSQSALGYVTPTRRASRSRSRSPQSSLARGSASPTRHAWFSSASPRGYPPAQEEAVSKVVIDDHNPVGYIWADPRASVQSVLRTIRKDLAIVVEIVFQPENVDVWGNVERLLFSPMPEICASFYKDLRIDRWELYQLPREIPIMRNGKVEQFLVVPSVLDPATVQFRLDNWNPIKYHYFLSLVDVDNWVVIRRSHPQRVRLELLAHRTMVHDMVQRAGQRNGLSPFMDDADPLYQPLVHGPLIRAGVRHQRVNVADPRSAMLIWAQQRIARDLPHANHTAIATLLRAENRTVCAVLNARSTLQVQEAVEAAWRRAGLPGVAVPRRAPEPSVPPADGDEAEHGPRSREVDQVSHDPQHSEVVRVLPPHLQQMTDALFRQTVSIQNILGVLQAQPTVHDFMNMMNAMQLQSNAQVQAITEFAQALARVEALMAQLQGEPGDLARLSQETMMVASPIPTRMRDVPTPRYEGDNGPPLQSLISPPQVLSAGRGQLQQTSSLDGQNQEVHDVHQLEEQHVSAQHEAADGQEPGHADEEGGQAPQQSTRHLDAESAQDQAQAEGEDPPATMPPTPQPITLNAHDTNVQESVILSRLQERSEQALSRVPRASLRPFGRP